MWRRLDCNNFVVVATFCDINAKSRIFTSIAHAAYLCRTSCVFVVPLLPSSDQTYYNISKVSFDRSIRYSAFPTIRKDVSNQIQPSNLRMVKNFAGESASGALIPSRSLSRLWVSLRWGGIMGIHVKVPSFVVDFYPAKYFFECQDGHYYYFCRYYAIRINDVHILCSCPTLIFWFWLLVVCRIDRFAPTPWNPSFPQHLSIKFHILHPKEYCILLFFVGTLTLQRHGHPMFLRMILNRFTSPQRGGQWKRECLRNCPCETKEGCQGLVCLWINPGVVIISYCTHNSVVKFQTYFLIFTPREMNQFDYFSNGLVQPPS